MDDAAYKNLVRKARLLYTIIADMEKVLLDMFINEFIEFDEREQRMRSEREMLPF